MRRCCVLLVCLVCLALGAGSSGPARADEDGCAAADRLFRGSHGAEEERARLEQAIELCSDHAPALNNLGLMMETGGDLEAAEALYRRSIAAGGGAAPYAGLGDVQAARGNEEAARTSYTRFLEELGKEVAAGDPHRIGRREAAYRKKLADLGGPDTGVVAAEGVTRGLTVAPTGDGADVVHHEEPHIDLPILFEHDSERLTRSAGSQVLEIARALRSPELAGDRVLVEGHTDATGGADYNRDLSERRARSVARALVDLGVAEARLTTEGRGEARPVADNDSAAGRARNRRVTFVNLDRGP